MTKKMKLYTCRECGETSKCIELNVWFKAEKDTTIFKRPVNPPFFCCKCNNGKSHHYNASPEITFVLGVCIVHFQEFMKADYLNDKLYQIDKAIYNNWEPITEIISNIRGLYGLD